MKSCSTNSSTGISNLALTGSMPGENDVMLSDLVRDHYGKMDKVDPEVKVFVTQA